MIKDSGERRQFDSGAVRDIQEGKGRCDLLPLDVVSDLLDNDIVEYIARFTTEGDVTYLKNAIIKFIGGGPGNIAGNMLEVSILFEDGCKKYGENNWQKGIPLHSFIDSGVRHYLKWLCGDDDENHGRSFVWNLMCAIWTIKNKPEMIDIGMVAKDV